MIEITLFILQVSEDLFPEDSPPAAIEHVARLAGERAERFFLNPPIVQAGS